MTVRVSVEDLNVWFAELRALREQVASLQTGQTAHLLAARAAAFEAAALRCESFAQQLRIDSAIAAAHDCALEIRALAKTP
jgi:hypothetical protein